MKTCLHLIHVQYTITYNNSKVYSTFHIFFSFLYSFFYFNKGVGVGGGGAFPTFQETLKKDRGPL